MDARTVERLDDRGALNLGDLLAKNPELQIARDNYNINVTSNDGERMTVAQVADAFSVHPGAGQPAHLYFHFPLCNYICHFCSYVKRLVPKGKEDESLLVWSEMLREESRRYLDRFGWIADAEIGSFYIGGGTAALLLNSDTAIRSLVEHVNANYHFAARCERTIEGNPENFRTPLIERACELGFNRFSLGIQSFQDEVNDFTKRRHTAVESLTAVQNLVETGYPFNVDMMFGLPYQTVQSVRDDIQRLVDLGVPTITIYRLRNADREEMGIGNRAVWNVPSVRDRLAREGYFPDLERTYEMREAAVTVLLDHEYHPSPCGWWSRPGTYPDGNIPLVSKDKWEHYDTMIAHGPGAYGWLTGRQEHVVQTHNLLDINQYMEFMQQESGLPLSHGRRLEGHKAVGATLGFNFKANQPIRLDRYRAQFGADLLSTEPFSSAFAELLARGLVQMTDDGEALIPTLAGEALHEEIIYTYFHQRIGLSNSPVCRR